jgi:hypothetical protein
MIKIQRELNDETKMILKTTPHNIVQNPLAVAWFDMLTTLWRSVSCSGPLCAINDEDEETIKIQRELNDETKMILKTTPHNIVQNPLPSHGSTCSPRYGVAYLALDRCVP